MARMLPSVISPDIKSNAERKVFEWFRDSKGTEDWIVLHSLGISNHNKNIYGETDFFVLAPGLGIYALEVKGGRVRRKNGIWYFTNRYGKIGYKERGPFDQARDSVFSIIEALKKRLDDEHNHLRRVFFGSGVMFPDTEYEAVGIDEEQWQVFDCNDGNNIKSFIERMAKGSIKKWEARYGLLDKKKLPTIEDIEYIASVLRGDFDKAISISVQLRYAEEALVNLTNEQYRCLDQLDDNPRCLILGAAGTGKTLLAVEEAKKSVSKGERVALFCFNANLADWMDYYFSRLPENLKPAYVGTFHKYMRSVINEQGIHINQLEDGNMGSSFFREDIPEAAKKALQYNENKFDKIIVDEAQDLISLKYLDVMNLCLKRGFERGRWTMFGDFEMQAIYSDKYTGEELIQLIEDKTAFVRFKLTINCRNTKPIVEEVQTVTGFKAPKGLWSKVEGPPVNYITYKSLEECKSRLEDLLLSLTQNNIDEKNITILSPFKRENSVISLIDSFAISDYKPEGNDKISFCTIQGYKGLENMIIILSDIESLQADKLMYVGLSRARSGLYIFVSETATKEYLELQQRRFIK